MNNILFRGAKLCSLGLLAVILTACGKPAETGTSSSEAVSSSSEVPVSSSSSSSSSISSSSSVLSVSSSSSESSISVSSSSAVVVISSSSSTPSVDSSASIVFFEDFEGGTVGQAPAGWDTFIGYNWNGDNRSDVYVKVDSSKKYNGSQSVHFRNSGDQAAQMVRELPDSVRTGKKLYLSAWVNMSQPMGNDSSDNHEHIFGVKKTKNANNEVRFGQGKGHLGMNEVPSDAIAPTQDKWYSGPTISPNAWHCVELELRGDLSYNTAQAWVDGELVHSIQAVNDWEHKLSNGSWIAEKLNYVFFGMQSYSSRSLDVWMDDVTVSTERIDCPR